MDENKLNSTHNYNAKKLRKTTFNRNAFDLGKLNMENITKDHILFAIKEIDKEGIRAGRHSSTYDLVYEGKHYPPKLVISIANKYATGVELNPNTFYGGTGTQAFQLLQKYGFEIRPKKDAILTLIANYKKHIKETQLKDEKYKWELVDQFKGRPNLDATDFLEEIKSINYSNLIYPLGKGVLYHLLNDKPEEVRAVFKVLFDESKDLTFRVNFFNTETLKIYRSLGEKLQHHQDERTISTYLTFNNPEKYTFYKYSFYKKLCGLLKENEAGKNEKYEHYLLLLNRIIEDYIREDLELIELVKNYIPDYYDGSNHLLLTQDILYQMLDKKEAVTTINVKSEYIDWMEANVSGGNYFKRQFGSNRERFEKEINEYEVKYKENFDSELFIITTTDYKNGIELIRTNLYNTSTPFSEYSNNHASGRPKAMLGKKQYLRFLEERFGTGSSVNYWIFQGSPKIYDAVSALNNNAVSTWTVSAHKDKIKEGDKFILWLTGANAGCYALGTIASEVTMMKEDDAEMSYYLSPTPQVENNRVRITIDYNLTESPVLWEMVKDDEAFADFKGSNQGTNFTATKEQYETFLDLASMENDNFEKVLQKFEFEDLKSYFNLLFEIIDTLNLKQGEERLLFTYRKDRLSFTIGQRIALLLLKKHHKGKYFVLTNDKIRTTSENFAGKEPLPFGTYLKELDLVPSERQSVFDGVLQELKRVQRSSYRSKNYSDFEEAVFNPAFRLRFQKTTNSIMSYKAPINQILYGPPGTGKTFKLQQIIEEWDLKEKTGLTKDYSVFVKDFTWWKIIALAILDLGKVKVPDLAKHPLIIAKLGSSNVKSINTRLWSSLQHHCVDDCENVKLLKRIGEKVFYKETNSEWRLDNPIAFQSEYDVLVEAYFEFKSSDNTKAKDYTFTTCHQSLTYEDFIEGIKPDLNNINEDDENGKEVIYEIRKGIFYNACEKAAQKAGFINLKDCLDKTKEKRKELFDKAIAENKIHVIFLDEINRCNVSSVFGELITLIEEDKRLGRENEIADITLPYSQETFGVPANLFIIGTMNTADRSVEALDTALRRRFSFEEMPPLYDLKKLDYSISEYKATDILKTINTRIEKLINKDHSIGHSYFLNKNNESIVESFYKNIIPLLQEYFFGDYGKIGLVLGKGFIKLKEYEDQTSIFADFDTDNANDYDDRNVYEIIDYRKVKDFKLRVNNTDLNMNFETAIQVLMNKKFE